MKLSNATYDKLKWVALVALPALAVLYLALSGLWSLPKAQEVSGTIMAVDAFLGALLGLAAKNYTPGTDGALEVAEDDTRFIGRLDLQVHPEELAQKSHITLEVKKVPMEPDAVVAPPE
jgi:hypothetical protein